MGTVGEINKALNSVLVLQTPSKVLATEELHKQQQKYNLKGGEKQRSRKADQKYLQRRGQRRRESKNRITDESNCDCEI